MLKTWLFHLFAVLTAMFLCTCPATALEEAEHRTDPAFLATPGIIDFGTLKKPGTAERSLYFYHRDGAAGQSWSLQSSKPWVVPNRTFGVFASKKPQRVRLSIDSRRLETGYHGADVTISGAGETLQVPLIVYVEDGARHGPRGSLQALKIEPSYPDPLAVGADRVFRAKGLYTSGDRKDITEQVQWHCDNRRTAEFVSPGVLRGKSEGYAGVIASAEDMESDRVPVFVDNAAGGPVLTLLGPGKLPGRLEVNTRKEFEIDIKNSGAGLLSWRLEATEPWIRIKRGQRETGHTKAGKRDRVTVLLDTYGLNDGDYRSSLVVRSNGGDGVLSFSVKVATIESVLVTPRKLSMREGERRRLTATALWSDGSRTDVSASRGGRWVVSNSLVVAYEGRGLFAGLAPGIAEVKRVERGIESRAVFIKVIETNPLAGLRVVPREIDLGLLGPGEEAAAVFEISREDARETDWTLLAPDGWISRSGDEFAGSFSGMSMSLNVRLSSSPADLRGFFTLELAVELDGKESRYYRTVRAGRHRDAMTLRFGDDLDRTIFLAYGISSEESRAVLDVKPRGLTLGVLEKGRMYMPKIRVKNRGKSVLSWEAGLRGLNEGSSGRQASSSPLISLYNGELKEDEPYIVPSAVADHVTLSGTWRVRNGYPVALKRGDTIRFHFQGTGVSAVLLKNENGGSFSAAIDDAHVGMIDCYSMSSKRSEVRLVEGLTDKIHVLTIVAEGSGEVNVEGCRPYGWSLKPLRRGVVRISPVKGATKEQTDYVNVVIDTTGLESGLYGENIVFSSNGGRDVVELIFQIMEEKTNDLVPVFYYTRGENVALWTEGEHSDETVLRGYRRKDIAFTLFSPDTPGTTPFYAWRHSGRGSWFYSTDRSAVDLEADGYEFLGSLGNIALVPLPETRELYRLYNPETRRYLYTQELRESEQKQKGYDYDGIAGYVR